MFKDAASYPVTNGAWIMILLGAIFSSILDLFQFAPIVGIGVSVFASGYFGSFYLSIVTTTMNGTDAVPDWPSFYDFLDDIIYPLINIISLVVISALPGIAIYFFISHDSLWFLPFFITAVVFFVFYFPMAVLGNCAFGGLHGALPNIVFPAIVHCMPSYLVSVGALAISVTTLWISEYFARNLPYFGWFIGSAIGLYGLMFQARVIGLIYRNRSDELQWD